MDKMLPQDDTTRLLLDARQGGLTGEAAAQRLMACVYDEMRALASRHMSHERADHTLQPTALAHEAWLRLIDQTRTDWKSRAHFFAVASEIIRRILVDHARLRRTAKRGGDRARVDLTESDRCSDRRDDLDLLSLHGALEQLAQLNPRHARIVELRFFGGLTIDETAHVLNVSPATVKLDWRAARAWLRTRLEE
jgi:RNA polymerase sigma-70 factor, ECF subfamily